MTLAGYPGGAVLHALAWLGPGKAPAAVVALKSTVPPAEARTLAGTSAELPVWLARQLSSLAA